jgi:amidase
MNLHTNTIIFVIISALALLGLSWLFANGPILGVPSPVPIESETAVKAPVQTPQETPTAIETPVAQPTESSGQLRLGATYIVQEDDDLASISTKAFGDSSYAPAIVWFSTIKASVDAAYSLNTENNSLTADQKLWIPTIAEIDQWQSEIDEAVSQNSFVEELSIQDIQRMMQAGTLTSRELVTAYAARIEAMNHSGPMLNAIIEINPELLAIADQLDLERATSGPRSPLHGIPILLKDNIDTADGMQTTAGSFTLLGSKPAQDAYVVEGLRKAGAIILGKANLSEWANYRSNSSISGWSGRGGLTRNPYRLDWTPWGSSSGSGVAVAANLVTVALGTETAGSITAPAVVNGVVGLKPTVGLTSRAGVIPIAHSFDTVGPLTRTVADAAAVLGALTGVDARDPMTSESEHKFHADYLQFLDADGLSHARIGIARGLLNDLAPDVEKLYNDAIEVMRSAGAEIIEIEEMPNLQEVFDYNSDEVSILSLLSYEFHDDIAAYLETRIADPERPNAFIPRTISDLIMRNEELANSELQLFGQELFDHTEMRGEINNEQYLEALETYRRLSGEEGIEVLMAEHNLDALVLPTNESLARIYAALAGYPLMTVPGGFTDNGIPWGLGFLAPQYSEPALIKLAYAYEQKTMHRMAPTYSLIELTK